MSYRVEELNKEIANLDPIESYWFKQGVMWADAHPTLMNHTRVRGQVEEVVYPYAYEFNYEEHIKRELAKMIGYKLLEEGLLNIQYSQTPDGFLRYCADTLVFTPKKKEKDDKDR